MLVSIIVPIYNVEQYLVRCIDSIINQTYQELEIILVNDGSPDGSLNICNDYAQMDQRIKVITQDNKGLSGARNTGIISAKGEYISFIDADDRVEESMIESYVNVAKEYNPDVILTNIYQYHKGNLTYTETKNNLPYGKVLNKKLISEHIIQPYYGGYLGIIPSACTKLYKRNFLKNYSLLFDQTLKRSEDYWFNLFVFQNSEYVYCLNKSFYHYYSNQGSMIKSFREGQFQAFLDNRTKLLKAHENFVFPIHWKELNNQFVNNINELILLEINVKGIKKAYKNIHSYLTHKEFLKIYSNSSPTKKHIRMIKFLLSKGMIIPAIMSFTLWSLQET